MIHPSCDRCFVEITNCIVQDLIGLGCGRPLLTLKTSKCCTCFSASYKFHICVFLLFLPPSYGYGYALELFLKGY